MSYNQPLKDPDRLLGNFIADDETDDEGDERWYAGMDNQKKEEKDEERAREKANFDVKNNGLEEAKKLQGALNSMLDVDYNKMMEEYKLSAKYGETDKKLFLNGFMWQAHLDMRELYEEFVEKVKPPLDEIKNTFSNNNTYGYDLKTGDNEVMDDTVALTKPKKELETLYKKFRKNVSETGKMANNNEIKLPFPYCPPLDKTGNVIKSNEKFEKEEKNFITKWLAFCENVKKKESEVTEYKRKDVEEKEKEFKAEEKYPEAFFEWDIPIDHRFLDAYSNITNIDQIVLGWIKLKTEKRKKGGRKRTRRKNLKRRTRGKLRAKSRSKSRKKRRRKRRKSRRRKNFKKRTKRRR